MRGLSSERSSAGQVPMRADHPYWFVNVLGYAPPVSILTWCDDLIAPKDARNDTIASTQCQLSNRSFRMCQTVSIQPDPHGKGDFQWRPITPFAGRSWR